LGRLIDSFSGDDFGYYVLPQFRADVLAIGALIAWWKFTAAKNAEVTRNVKRLLIASAFAIPLVVVAGSGTFHAAAWEHTLAEVFFGAVVFSVLENQGSPGLSFLRSSIFSPLAAWSYASYMIHHWVAYIVFAALGVTRTLTTFAGIATTALSVVVTFGLCALSYRILERPLNRYAHHRFSFAAAKVPAFSAAE
jgi:peptidoglycan/LPS O-acetylase OafA/YrhL